jgi:hypothetical protein
MRLRHARDKERKYRSYSFLNSALDGGEWLASRSGHVLPPRKEPTVPIKQKAGWASELNSSQRLEKKIFCLWWEWNLCLPAYSQTLIEEYLIKYF